MAKKKKTKVAKKTSKVAKKKIARKKTAPEAGVSVKIVTNSSEDAMTVYSNHAEVAHALHEFMIIFGRLPTKATPSQVVEAKERGVIQVEPDVQVLIPPTLVRGLIGALEAQLKKYEAEHGKLHVGKGN